ncbi:MAG: tRNA guanosine(15) transglycosylase TgtA [archaeon GB-1867-035]|nr:tRNA guanosine(15) transglycosylase TgtA [Candidatus Culexmicrobium profundum]
MAFEIKERDLAGRIGKIATKKGVLETPIFLPVINPWNNIIPIEELKEKFSLKAVITNAYIIKKKLLSKGRDVFDVHEIINFDKIIMTDSGAYQLLVYGTIDLKAEEIIRIQEKLNSDIAVILDIPTSKDLPYKEALETVKKTLENAEVSLKAKSREDILWVGPVQGGPYEDLVELCAKKLSKMDFDIYGIGGPTQFMEKYQFDELIDLVMTAKEELPIEKPIHLFGAGHPIVMPLLVAMGCDTFDSASYALYARDERYITPLRTIKFSRLKYLPCNCNVCSRFEVEDLREMERRERIKLIAEHNLSVILREIDEIKQAIHEGSLWELIEIKAKAHPQLYKAIKKLSKYKNYLEKFDPIVKGEIKGIFYTGSEGLIRPEVTRHLMKMRENIRFPEKRILILIPDPKEKPFSKSRYVREIMKIIKKSCHEEKINKIHECIYCIPFGVIPLELDEVYPLSQYEAVESRNEDEREVIFNSIKELISQNKYSNVIFISAENIAQVIIEKLKHLCRERKISLHIIEEKTLKKLHDILKKVEI